MTTFKLQPPTRYADTSDGVIWMFRFGFYERPSPEVMAAENRLMEILNSKEVSDLRNILSPWDGRVRYERVCAIERNPDAEETKRLREEALEAIAKQFPDHDVVSVWLNSSNGLHGLSVKIAPKKV